MRRTKKRAAPAKAARKKAIPRAEQTEPAVVHGPKATLAPPLAPTSYEFTRKRYTKAATREHLNAVEQLLMQAHSEAAIIKAMRENFDVGASRTRSLMARVYDEWSKVDAETRRHKRAAQVRRLERYIRECDGRRGAGGSWIEKPNHQARAKYEELLMKITGTAAPIEMTLNVQVSDALTGVINSMSDEDVARIMGEYHEMKLLADKAKTLGIEASPVSSDAAAE